MSFEFRKMTKEQQTEAFYKMIYGPRNHFIDATDSSVLQEDVMHQTDINDQLNLLIESLMEDEDYDIYYEELCETLQGIINVHELRTNKLSKHVKIIYSLDEYSDENKKKRLDKHLNDDMIDE